MSKVADKCDKEFWKTVKDCVCRGKGADFAFILDYCRDYPEATAKLKEYVEGDIRILGGFLEELYEGFALLQDKLAEAHLDVKTLSLLPEMEEMDVMKSMINSGRKEKGQRT